MLDIRRRTGVLFLSVTLAHVILISAQVQSKSGVPVLEAVTFGVFSRVQLAVAGVFRAVGSVWGNYVGLRGAQAQNEGLRRQVADLEVRLQEQRALAARAAGLEELLALRTSTELPLLAAEVIAGNPNTGMRTVTIDRGSDEGVRPNMAVISQKGVVGRVIGRPASHASIVQLLIDRSAAAGAVTERGRAGGLVQGVDRDPPLAMEFVSNLADVRPGDTVVASGVDGIYPRGFTIGEVESSDRGPQLHRAIAVRPAVDFSSLDLVFVVLVPARAAMPAEAAQPAGVAK